MRLLDLTFRAKVMLLLCGVILLMGIVAVVNARHDMQRILRNELERRGEAIAMDIAANSTDSLLTGDIIDLYESVNRTKINNPDVRYILIIDSSERVLVNTFGEGIPRGLQEANVPLIPGHDTQLRRLRTEEGLIYDVAAPVFEGRAGVVRIGLSDASIVAAVTHNSRDLTVLVVVAVVVGMVFSYWLSYYLTRPMGQLLAAVQSVARGDLTQRIPSPSSDEVGKLGEAFNTMSLELESKEIARQRLMERVVNTQEYERKRIARELHDELAQRVTYLLLNLDSIASSLTDADQRTKQVISRASEVAGNLLTETRKLIADLRPSILNDLGLIPAIRSYAESHLEPLGTDVTVTATNVPESLPALVDTAVFRIVQEAINNVGKHATARRASIVIKVDDGTVSGEVVDNGQGFLSNAFDEASHLQGQGLGLQGMEERALVLGGTLSVKSGKKKGTRVSFSIPLLGRSDNPV